MNILVVHNFYKYSGGEDTVFNNEVRLLKENGNNVYTYTRNNNEIDNFNVFKKILLPFIFLFNIKTYYDIKRIINKNNIDLVHIHNTNYLISKSVYYAVNDCNKPIVQTIHNFRFLCPNGLLFRNDNICEECVTKGLHCSIKHNCYRNSKIQTLLMVINIKQLINSKVIKKMNFICLTEFNKNKLLKINELYKKEIIKESKVFIKPNFTYSNETNIIENDKRENFILYAARIERNKGIFDLLDAWKDIKDTNLVICGDGKDINEAKRFVKDNNITNIEFKGQTSHDNTIILMFKAKAFIAPSKWYEGFPMSIIEAFSVGTPVITVDFGNCGYLVKQDYNGFKYKPNDIDSLVLSINKINNLQLNDNAYQTFIKHYSNTINYKELDAIYKKIIN